MKYSVITFIRLLGHQCSITMSAAWFWLNMSFFITEIRLNILSFELHMAYFTLILHQSTCEQILKVRMRNQDHPSKDCNLDNKQYWYILKDGQTFTIRQRLWQISSIYFHFNLPGLNLALAAICLEIGPKGAGGSFFNFSCSSLAASSWSA